MKNYLLIKGYENAVYTKRVSRFFRVTCLLAICLAGHAAFAVTYTFNGSTSTSWALATNWTGGIPPNPLTTGNAIVINGGTNQCILNIGGTQTINSGASITISSGKTLTINSGNTLITAGTSTLTGILVVDGTLDMANTNVAIGALNGSGSVTHASGSAGNRTLTISGNSSSDFSGVISNGTATSVSIITNGTCTLSGLNTYTGTTNVNNGSLSINTIQSVSGGSSSLGAPATIANGTITVGGELIYTGSGHTSDRVLFVGGAAKISASGSGTLNLTGGMTGNSSSVELSGTGACIESGVMTSTVGAIGKSGTGSWTLSAANTFTGKTTIVSGTLIINTLQNVNGGSSSLGAPTNGSTGTIAIGATGVLQYTGGVQSSNRVINLTADGGTVDASGSGTLTLTGGVTGNSFDLNLTGSGLGVESGAITITNGTVTKAGTGSWTLSGASTYSNATIISAGTLIAGASAQNGVNGPFGNNSSAIVLGNAATTTNNSSPSLLIGGAFNMARQITIANQPTTGVYTIGGNTDNNSFFSSTITLNQPLTITQVANAGANKLNINAAISGVQNITKIGNGTVTFNSQNFSVNNLTISQGSLISTSGTLNIAGNFTNSGAFTNNNGTIVMNGTGLQTISGFVFFKNLTIKNTGGVAPTNNIDISSNILVNGILSFDVTNKSNVSCGTNTVTVSGGSVTGAGTGKGWVNGKLEKSVEMSDVSTSFEIGDATLYAPLSLTYTSSLAIAGSLTASTEATDADLTGSLFNTAPQTLKRHWDVVNNGLGVSDYDITVFFNNPGDMFQNGADANTFFLDKLDGSTWAHNHTVTRTSNSVTASGVFNSFSTFQIGNYVNEAPAYVSNMTFSPTICPDLISSSASASATVSGVPLPTVVWWESSDGGVNYDPISSGGTNPVYAISSSTTAYTITSTLTLSKVPSSYNGNFYKATFTNTAGSIDVNTLPLLVYPTPTTIISGGGTICNGQSATVNIALTGASPWTLTYTDGTTPITVAGITASPYTFVTSPSTTKTYTVSSMTDGNGCAASSLTGSALVTVVNQPPPSINISAGGSTDFCFGNSVTLSASQTSNLVWSNGATSSSITITSVSGNYSVTYTSPATGCSSTSSSTAVNVKVAPEAKVTVTGNITGMCPGDQATLSASASDDGGVSPLTYQWYDTSGPISGQTGSSYVITAPPSGSYWVVVTNNNGTGCSSVVCP